MHYVWWTLIFVVMAAGLVGTLVPLLPGTAIILGAAVLEHFTVEPEHRIGWWTIAALAGLTLASYVVDLVSGTVGAKWFGATRWGAVGGIIGTIVGLFFGIIGIFVGPLIGVLVGELIGGKELLPAGKSTWGTLLGTAAGMIARFIIASVMIAWFIVAAFLL
jgi:uncharacterized protein YqgC (DUF456 family)